MKWRVPWAKPWITPADREAVLYVLRSGRLACGPKVDALEAAFAKAHGYAHAVAVSSGMAALELMLKNVGTRAVEVTGATFPPVYSHLLDYRVVDLGTPASESRLILQTRLYAEFCEPAGEAHLADWAQGVGSSPANLCDACYSFYPNKGLTAGEGGMICTQDAKRAAWYRSARNNGRQDLAGWLPVQWGGNYRMDEMSAALLRSQLQRMPRILDMRRVRWARYAAELDTSWRDDPAPWTAFAFPLTLDTAAERNNVAWALAKARIETRFPFPAQPRCPNWADWVERTVLLPFYTTMTESDQALVIRTARRAL